MRYGELWFRLLNAELEAAAREALAEQLRRVLGPRAAMLEDGFFARQAPRLLAARRLWSQAGQVDAMLLLQPLLDAEGVSQDSPLVDALLMPGSQRAPLRPAELDRLLLRALVSGCAQYLHDLAHSSRSEPVQRCQGLSPDLQLRWAERPGFAPLADSGLVQQQLGPRTDERFARCAMLFEPGGKGGFCSRRCRDRSHALARRIKNPRYDAERQERYRARLREDAP